MEHKTPYSSDTSEDTDYGEIEESESDYKPAKKQKRGGKQAGRGRKRQTFGTKRQKSGEKNYDSDRARRKTRGEKNQSSRTKQQEKDASGRGRGRTRGRRTSSSGQAKMARQRGQQTNERYEEAVINTMERRKEQDVRGQKRLVFCSKEIVAALSEEQVRELLKKTIQRQPSLPFDLLATQPVPQPPIAQHDGAPPSPQGDDPQPAPLPDADVPEWCICQSCREMPTEAEKLCCGQQPVFCISHLPDFQLLVLDEQVLAIARNYRREILAFPDDIDMNKNNRHTAYRQFTLWQHGRLGAGNPRVIPSCCVWKIRTKFPDQFGQYTGYIPGRLG